MPLNSGYVLLTRGVQVSINLFMSFDTIFWKIILQLKLCKQTSHQSTTAFFSQLKIIANFQFKISYEKGMNKSHIYP